MDNRKFVKMEKEFINGFGSWQETHFEVVDYITSIRNEDFIRGLVVETVESQGTGGLWELAEQWTDEFEKLNKNREWDGEFYDEIEEFCREKKLKTEK